MPNSFDDSIEPQTEIDAYKNVDSTDEMRSSDADIDAYGDDDLNNAKRAWNEEDVSGPSTEIDEEDSIRLAEPFVGQWNRLISTTNWEKGRIISEWRQAAIVAGQPSGSYSDECWARRVGGVTAPHVGRLRRVYDRFALTFETYDNIFWTHFLAALDWDDAPLWLEGAARESWSVSEMRQVRWEAHGAVDSQRPNPNQIIAVEIDEDITLPAQGGGRTKAWDEDGNVAKGPRAEDPDFGDEEPLTTMGAGGKSGTNLEDPDSPRPKLPVQPFAGLPELPPDLSDAVEAFKLAVLRHKTSGWDLVSVDTVNRYLDALAILLTA
jgi:hypothetical protein